MAAERGADALEGILALMKKYLARGQKRAALAEGRWKRPPGPM